MEDVKRVLSKQKPDLVLNKFIQSYLEGLYYTPLQAIKEDYESLIIREYVEVEPEVCPQVFDEETQEMIDDATWVPAKTQQELDEIIIVHMEASYPWLKELVVVEDHQLEYDSLVQKIVDFVPDVDEEGQTPLTTGEETRKVEIETLYPWLPMEWTRMIPDPNVNVEDWRRVNYVILRQPFLQSIDSDSLYEAMHDARQGDDSKIIAHDAEIAAVKERFPKPI